MLQKLLKEVWRSQQGGEGRAARPGDCSQNLSSILPRVCLLLPLSVLSQPVHTTDTMYPCACPFRLSFGDSIAEATLLHLHSEAPTAVQTSRC